MGNCGSRQQHDQISNATESETEHLYFATTRRLLPQCTLISMNDHANTTLSDMLPNRVYQVEPPKTILRAWFSATMAPLESIGQTGTFSWLNILEVCFGRNHFRASLDGGIRQRPPCTPLRPKAALDCAKENDWRKVHFVGGA
jgi:hypothetical protein